MNSDQSTEKPVIRVSVLVDAPIEKVWDYFTMPSHITRWNNPSANWHTPNASADLKEGGKFNYRMEAKDGSEGFNFEGVYDVITPNEYIAYTIADGRKVSVKFIADNYKTNIIEQFETENINMPEMQKNGWQAILDSFKQYIETH